MYDSAIYCAMCMYVLLTKTIQHPFLQEKDLLDVRVLCDMRIGLETWKHHSKQMHKGGWALVRKHVC